jgi:hypothetical protein
MDDVTFDNTSNTISIVDPAFASSIHGLTITAAHTSAILLNHNLIVIGTTNQSGGDISGAGTFEVPAGGVYNWNAGIIETGTYGPGVVPGVTQIDNRATMNITGNTIKTLDARNITNNGSVYWTSPGGSINLKDGAQFQNMASSSFLSVMGGTGGNFMNGDTAHDGVDATQLIISAGAQFVVSAQTTSIGTFFADSGGVNVQFGNLSFGGGVTDSAGWTLQGGSLLTFGGTGTQQYTFNGTTISGGGTTDLVSNFGPTNFVMNGSVTMSNLIQDTLANIDGSGTFNVTGTYTWSGGDWQGSGTTHIASGAQLTISTGRSTYVGRSLLNDGTVVWTGATALTFNATSLVNGINALFDIQSDQSMTTAKPDNQLPVFSNQGTVRKSAGTGTSTIGIAFTNAGNLQVMTGTLAFTKTATQTTGTTTLSNSAILSTTTSYVLQGGTLSTSVHGQIAGSLINNGGTVFVGGDRTAGSLTINGNYTQGPQGTLSIDILGPNQVTQYDFLNVGGSVNLAGTLAVHTTGYDPPRQVFFDIMSFSSRVGDFTNFTGMSLPNNKAYLPSPSDTEYELEVV